MTQEKLVRKKGKPKEVKMEMETSLEWNNIFHMKERNFIRWDT